MPGKEGLLCSLSCHHQLCYPVDLRVKLTLDGWVGVSAHHRLSGDLLNRPCSCVSSHLVGSGLEAGKEVSNV